MLAKVLTYLAAALCLAACGPSRQPLEKPASEPATAPLIEAASPPPPCPLPSGTWRIASYVFEDGVVAVSDDEARAVVGQTVQVTADTYRFATGQCRIKSVDQDTNDGVTAATAPLLYTYDCADDQVLPSIAMDTACKVRSAGLDGAWYILE